MLDSEAEGVDDHLNKEVDDILKPPCLDGRSPANKSYGAKSHGKLDCGKDIILDKSILICTVLENDLGIYKIVEDRGNHTCNDLGSDRMENGKE